MNIADNKVTLELTIRESQSLHLMMTTLTKNNTAAMATFRGVLPAGCLEDMLEIRRDLDVLFLAPYKDQLK